MPANVGYGRSVDASVEPWHPRWMPRLIVMFAIVSLAVVVAFFVSGGMHGGGFWFDLSHVLSLGAFAYGVSTSRRGFRRDWRLALIAMTVWVVGDMTGAANTTPSGGGELWQFGVLLSATAYTLMTIAVIRMSRRDGFVRSTTIPIDAAIFALGTFSSWWVLVGDHALAHGRPLSVPAAIAATIPLMDGTLLAASAMLLSSRSGHALSSRALVVMCMCGLTGDIGFARFLLGMMSSLPSWVPACWMLQFVAAGVAALGSSRASVRSDTHISPDAGYLAMTCVVTGALTAIASTVPNGLGLTIDTDAAVVVAGMLLALALLYGARQRHQVRVITRQSAQMERNARTDHLTQLPNRRAGERILESAVRTAQAAPGTDLAVAILDLDRFKLYNDTYGHQQGDQLLRASALAWSSVLAGRGTLFRYGGEEFVVVLRGTAKDTAETILDELQRATPREQSFSAGLAMLRFDDDAQSVVGRADESLYAAKEAGRARTVAAA